MVKYESLVLNMNLLSFVCVFLILHVLLLSVLNQLYSYLCVRKSQIVFKMFHSSKLFKFSKMFQMSSGCRQPFA